MSPLPFVGIIVRAFRYERGLQSVDDLLRLILHS